MIQSVIYYKNKKVKECYCRAVAMTWLLMHGHVFQARGKKFVDPDWTIREEEICQTKTKKN